jgi:hypothetical protein
MQKVEIWGAVKVGNRVYRDNEILQLIGKPIAPWKFADDLPNDECNICLGFGEEKRVKLGAKMQRPRPVMLLILTAGAGARKRPIIPSA